MPPIPIATISRCPQLSFQWYVQTCTGRLVEGRRKENSRVGTLQSNNKLWDCFLCETEYLAVILSKYLTFQQIYLIWEVSITIKFYLSKYKDNIKKVYPEAYEMRPVKSAEEYGKYNN